MNFKRSFFHFSYIFLFLITQSLLFAQWPKTVQEELFIGYGVYPKAVSDGNGGVFIAATYNSYYSSVRIQRVNRNGNIIWLNQLILTGSKHQQTLVNADIVSDGNGGMYLVYYDTHFIEYPYIINIYLRVQHIDSTGNQLWSNNGVTLVTPADTTQQSKCTGGETVSDGENGIIVSWLDYRNTSARSDYGDNYIQRIDINGNCLWDSGGVRISTRSGCADAPHVVTDGSSGAIINYYESRSIYFQRVDQNGNKLWGERGIQEPDSMGVLDIIPDGESGIFLICRKTKLYPKLEYWCQRLDSNGVYLYEDDGIYIGEGEYFESGIDKPVLNPDQSISFTWYFKEKEYFQKITKEGLKIFTGSGISVTNLDSAYAYAPVLGINGDNYCFITKQVSRLNYEGRLFIQQIDQDGTLLFGDEGICISDTRGRDLALGIYDVVPDANDGFILIFMSDPGYLFAKQVSGDGILGHVNTGIDTEPTKLLPSAIQLYQNYPNPFNAPTTICFDITNPGYVILAIYDILGREIETLIIEFKPAGKYEYKWRPEDLSSGIYLYSLRVGEFSEVKKMILLR